MTVTQAVLLAVGLATLEAALIVGALELVRHLHLRRLERRWKGALKQDSGRLIVLPNPCTCCPVHAGSQPTTEGETHG